MGFRLHGRLSGRPLSYQTARWDVAYPIASGFFGPSSNKPENGIGTLVKHSSSNEKANRAFRE